MNAQRNRMVELVGILNEARKVYEQGKDELISNKQYDAYYDELVMLESVLGEVLPNSPTQQVGYEVVSSLNKVKHETKMLSLDKTKDVEELKKFLGDREGLLSWKMDGLTVVITYENGKLVKGVTRGNGEIGEDITHNVRQFKNVPQVIDYKGKLVLRGEAVISYETFNEINSKLPPDEQYKNPRNLVSGTVRQLDSKVCAERGVEWICFEVVEGLDNHNLKSLNFADLVVMGFDVVERSVVDNEDVVKIVNNINASDSDYPVDGLVLTFNDIEYSKSLPVTSHHPTHSIAYKWQDETYETTLLDIEWNVGRTGVITPVAIFEPVEIDGSTVERASLHNLDFMGELELGIGDTITVYKSNMIIPCVDDNLTRSNSVEIPQYCPSCGQKTTIFKQNSATLMCENPDCKQKVLARFEHFVSRDCMNIVGLSSATLELLISRGWISEFADLYNNADWFVDLEYEKGWTPKSIQKLIDAIGNSKKCTLAQFITSLGIDGVGKSQGKLLANEFKTYAVFVTSGVKNYQEVNGIGVVTATNIDNYLNENIEKIEELAQQLDIQPVESTPQATTTITGKTFVITGSINHYANRNALQAEIESLGGKVSGSVSSKTDYLINNENISTSSKNKKALELGVKIITEDEYIVLKNS